MHEDEKEALVLSDPVKLFPRLEACCFCMQNSEGSLSKDNNRWTSIDVCIVAVVINFHSGLIFVLIKPISCLQIEKFDLNVAQCELENNAESRSVHKTENVSPGAALSEIPVSPKRCQKRIYGNSVVCPKATCHKQYKHRHKLKLLNHIEKHHRTDPDYNKLFANFRLIFPERNKTPRKACSVCGKLIAGRGAQMNKHQRTSACKLSDK